MKQKFSVFSVILIASLLLSACGSIANFIPMPFDKQAAAPTATLLEQAQPQKVAGSRVTTSLTAYQTALEDIYTLVNPSVVSIRVVQKQEISMSNPGLPNLPFFSLPGFPNLFGSPGQDNNQPNEPQYTQALGSGFVWNQDGYIVTNNHVVSGADKIEVKFADGTAVSAKLIGTDLDSDLAVIKVDDVGFALSPITVSDSTDVKVGQIAVAIGNPFGLENTMTVGIVSALGRTLPASQGSASGATYTIPDIIQTDAPINPGNSGGPLVDDRGALIGVNAAIESPVRANSGIGFAIPSLIVSRVVPALIQNGKYEHPYIGISGFSLTPDVAKAMNLDATQRGALIEDILPGSPADKGNLLGSDRQASIDGQDVRIGGDLITAIDNTPVKSIEDVIAYIADHTDVGQKVKLTILRNGKEKTINVTLEARPAQAETTQAAQSDPQQQRAWLGIAGQPLTLEIAKAMNLPENQTGVLVEQVQAGSPADKAGLQGSFKPVLLNGQRVLVGGDVITTIDGKSLTTFEDLLAFMQTAKPGQQISLAILRDGIEKNITVILTEHP